MTKEQAIAGRALGTESCGRESFGFELASLGAAALLLDNNIDHRFARLLTEHEVVHARRMGWAELLNGDLIAAAEEAGFGRSHHGETKRFTTNRTFPGPEKITIITLNPVFASDLRGMTPLVPQVLAALNNLPLGAFIIIDPESSA